VQPPKVPDLFASRPIVVFGKWRGRAAGSIGISGRTGRGPYSASVAVTPGRAHASHRALRHLWARARIADLSDFGPAAPDEARVAAVTSLGLTYGLLTRYTSFVAVQEIVRRAGGDAAEVDQPLPLPAGVSDRAVGITSGSEPPIVWVAAGIVVLLAWLRLFGGRRRRAGGLA
jgi:Ca-activated chloride channel family protein